MGKGMPAALMMSSFQGALQAYANALMPCQGVLHICAQTECKADVVKEIISRLNKMACHECRNGEFVTLFYAIIDVKEKTITYCNCGHEPSVLIRNGRIMDLEKGGLVLGVDAQAEYEIETVELKDGDSLLFYTDGLIDAVNFDDEFWGRENLLETAKKYTADSAEEMINNILRYRRRFVGLARQIDDTSIVVVKVRQC